MENSACLRRKVTLTGCLGGNGASPSSVPHDPGPPWTLRLLHPAPPLRSPSITLAASATLRQPHMMTQFDTSIVQQKTLAQETDRTRQSDGELLRPGIALLQKQISSIFSLDSKARGDQFPGSDESVGRQRTLAGTGGHRPGDKRRRGALVICDSAAWRVIHHERNYANRELPHRLSPMAMGSHMLANAHAGKSPTADGRCARRDLAHSVVGAEWIASSPRLRPRHSLYERDFNYRVITQTNDDKDKLPTCRTPAAAWRSSIQELQQPPPPLRTLQMEASGNAQRKFGVRGTRLIDY
ncbi:hypothetical protein BDK51DRAFT_48755 [Blyttiomyces helicus]|uniref:Uncharacterized protein n=1 Tax=Blyttiomyces helicus TaxID=388810 RepID=A0A4P9W4R7_9FUNG|nr:hypothetical protein BDK51DRAFT_48755 [Blyttiomyces helicus]|eukprot:RKO87351.1 hypothetical protein BDK51DRAFT_48755 [Blyttiomyces helicus]